MLFFDEACAPYLSWPRTPLTLQSAAAPLSLSRRSAQNEMAAVRVMAKDLVRTRQHISKFTVMKSNLQSLSLQMQVRW